MKFKPGTYDPNQQLHHPLVSETGLVTFGIYRVLYGWRIRAGFTDDGCFFTDWCCGADWRRVEYAYAIMRTILEQRHETPDCFKGLPRHSQIKPLWNDADFVNAIVAACYGAHVIPDRLEEPNLLTYLLEALG